MVVLRAVIRDLATGPQARQMMSTIMIMIAVPPQLAPLSGAGLLAPGDWRLIFPALPGAAVPGLFLIHCAVPETPSDANRQRFDQASTLAGTRVLLAESGFMVMTFLAGFAFASFLAFIAGAAFVSRNPFGLTPARFPFAFAVNAFGFFAPHGSARPCRSGWAGCA